MRGAGGKAFISGADISEFDTKRGSAAQKDEYGMWLPVAPITGWQPLPNR